MNACLELDGIAKSYPQDITDLESVLLFVMEKELPGDGMIAEVKVDGKTYSEDYRHQARKVHLSTVGRVEILTKSKKVFAEEFATQIPHYLSHLSEGFRTSAALFHTPTQEENGYDMLAKSLDALSAFKNHLYHVEGLLGDKGSGGMPNFGERFENIADDLLKAQESMDAPAISELLETKLIPFLENWREKINNADA